MTDIKPCPFCGDTYAVIYTTLEDGYHAECLECHAKTDWFSTKVEAIAAWNRRADGWIPVTPDTLPPAYEDIWVTDGETVEPGYYTGCDFYVENQLWNRHVTHWMPKPLPPKEAE